MKARHRTSGVIVEAAPDVLARMGSEWMPQCEPQRSRPRPRQRRQPKPKSD